MNWLALPILAFFAGAASAQSPVLDTDIEGEEPAEELALDGAVAHLRGLDTISGTVSDLFVPVGGSAKFGRLTVSVSKCRYFPENPSTQSYAYVTILAEPNPQAIFEAWMIASAPALSAVEHHRYDIWLIRCSAAAESASNG